MRTSSGELEEAGRTSASVPNLSTNSMTSVEPFMPGF